MDEPPPPASMHTTQHTPRARTHLDQLFQLADNVLVRHPYFLRVGPDWLLRAGIAGPAELLQLRHDGQARARVHDSARLLSAAVAHDVCVCVFVCVCVWGAVAAAIPRFAAQFGHGGMLMSSCLRMVLRAAMAARTSTASSRFVRALVPDLEGHRQVTVGRSTPLRIRGVPVRIGVALPRFRAGVSSLNRAHFPEIQQFHALAAWPGNWRPAAPARRDTRRRARRVSAGIVRMCVPAGVNTLPGHTARSRRQAIRGRAPPRWHPRGRTALASPPAELPPGSLVVRLRLPRAPCGLSQATLGSGVHRPARRCACKRRGEAVSAAATHAAGARER